MHTTMAMSSSITVTKLLALLEFRMAKHSLKLVWLPVRVLASAPALARHRLVYQLYTRTVATRTTCTPCNLITRALQLLEPLLLLLLLPLKALQLPQAGLRVPHPRLQSQLVSANHWSSLIPRHKKQLRSRQNRHLLLQRQRRKLHLLLLSLKQRPPRSKHLKLQHRPRRRLPMRPSPSLNLTLCMLLFKRNSLERKETAAPRPLSPRHPQRVLRRPRRNLPQRQLPPLLTPRLPLWLLLHQSQKLRQFPRFHKRNDSARKLKPKQTLKSNFA
mmetsp:Transcript_17919/g.31681  ORF Transcript_17919/g.31681 Transcript_17919/m.31681 type:complete len:273 (+) Transcript_17919:266-1084(+)